MNKRVKIIRVCNYRHCNNEIPGNRNAKAAYCCDKCKNYENILRRKEQFNRLYAQLEGLRQNHDILLHYPHNTILTFKELSNIGFDFDYMFQPSLENGCWVYRIGENILKDYGDEEAYILTKITYNEKFKK